jgi:hypothetical protein
MHCPPAAEGNFRDDHENGLKWVIMQNYNRNTGHVNKSDCTMNSYLTPSADGPGNIQQSYFPTYWTSPDNKPHSLENYGDLKHRHCKHWPLEGKRIWCCVYSAKNKHEQNSDVHNAMC